MQRVVDHYKKFSDRVTGKTVAALDWQLAPSGRVNDLATLRDLQYADNRLTLRPVLIKSEQTWRTWQNVQNALDHFSHDWHEHRNQLIAFQDVNRQGEKATDNWLQNLGIALKFAPFTHMEQAERPKAVWAEDKYLNNTRRSLYFDVIELLEHYRVLVP